MLMCVCIYTPTPTHQHPHPPTHTHRLFVGSRMKRLLEFDTALLEADPEFAPVSKRDLV
jgi:hypothetical protein